MSDFDYAIMPYDDYVDSCDAIREKTGSTDKIKSGEMGDLIRGIEGGGTELPTLTNEGVAADLVSGKQLIDQEGNIVEGTLTLDDELTTQEDLIAQIKSAANELPDANDSNDSNNSSDSNIEICTIVITSDIPLETPTFHYVDGDLKIATISANEATISVLKNSIMVIENWNSTCSSSGLCTQIFCQSGYAAYKITGDCNLIYSP